MLVNDLPIASFHTPAPLARGAWRVRGAAAPGRAESQVINVRLASSAQGREDAGMLLRRMYAWRGYAVEADAGNDARKVTLYAESAGALVGTMSLCLDRNGVLPADAHFGDLLDALRGEKRRLCEPSRLAIDKGMSKDVFAALMHISHLYACKLHGCTDYVIEVNPRHVAFYQQTLGFTVFGAQRECSRVGAPAVLLRLQLDEMGAALGRWDGTLECRGRQRSLYPYFCPVREEPGITARLAALCTTGERA